MLELLLFLFVSPQAQVPTDQLLPAAPDAVAAEEVVLEAQQVQQDYQVHVPVYFSEERPVVTAQSALVFDFDSQQFQFAKDLKSKQQIASITKLMTALIIVENHRMDEVVKVDQTKFSLIEGTTTVPNGMDFTVGELLHGMLIRSSNDLAYVLAVHHSGSVEQFVTEMNMRARELGMLGSQFGNPAGYDGSNNFSTAYDVYLMADAVWQYPIVREIAAKQSHELVNVDGSWRQTIYTTNQLLGGEYPFVGLKTGTTPAAGEAFVGVTSGSEPKLVVVLGSRSRFQDTKLLWEWAANVGR